MLQKKMHFLSQLLLLAFNQNYQLTANFKELSIKKILIIASSTDNIPFQTLCVSRDSVHIFSGVLHWLSAA